MTSQELCQDQIRYITVMALIKVNNFYSGQKLRLRAMYLKMPNNITGSLSGSKYKVTLGHTSHHYTVDWSRIANKNTVLWGHLNTALRPNQIQSRWPLVHEV